MHCNETSIILRRLMGYATEGTCCREEIKVEAAKLLRELLKPNSQPPQLPVNEIMQWLSENYPEEFAKASKEYSDGGKDIEEALDEFIEDNS